MRPVTPGLPAKGAARWRTAISAPPPAALTITPLALPTVPLSDHEVQHPASVEMHTASTLDSGADAAVNIYFLVDLDPVLSRFGNRGYRAAQLAAATAAGKLYLAADALRLGATGLTFFDDDVTASVSPRAAGRSVLFLFLIGIGRTPRRC